MCKEKDCKWVLAKDLPNPSLLEAGEKFKIHDHIISTMRNYPGDETKCLDNLILAKEGFEAVAPYRLRVCRECLRDLKRGTMPYAALANGLWLGDFPEHLRDATWVEMAAASPVRMSGHVFALEQLKVGGISGSAQRMMGGTFTFFFQNAYGVEKALPACAANIAGSMTVALVGSKPTDAQTRKLFGVRRSKLYEILEFERDPQKVLVGEHAVFKKADFSPENLNSYPEDGSIPPEIEASYIVTDDPAKSRENEKSSYVRDNRQVEIPVDETDADGADNDGVNDAYILDNNAVIPSGHEAAVADENKAL